MTDILNTFYTFQENEVIDENEQRIHMELMVYTHIWESKPFLKKLFRVAKAAKGEIYNWKVSVPEMGKHDFIRNDIRKTLEDCNCNLSEIIKKGFHTSLRNAFAHSEYYFDKVLNDKKIHLDNYKGNNWELREISFHDWSIRFIYSALLSYHLYDCINKCRKNLVVDFRTNIFSIEQPTRDELSIRNVLLEYNENQDIFRFKK